MSSLADIQRCFAASILGRNDNASRFIAGDGLPPELRLAIHRNNTYASLIEVLSGTFPRLAAQLGEQRFRAAATTYVAENPPRQPRLASYGRDFPAFLERFPPARPYPWLAELARLEWARHEAFFAPDALALTGDALAQIPPQRYGDLKLRLHPAVRLVGGRYPMHRLWEADSLPTDLEAHDTWVLVMRPDLAILHAALSAADAALLAAEASGSTVAAAAAAAFGRDPDHDLPRALAWHLSHAVFSAATVDP
ncbi:MAG: DNA-binding domain-containing protein [Nitrococcus sp.]|nr:DNA-binding domain-containing protein [Nitrococcus sp.]